jgi:hypothetical protein
VGGAINAQANMEIKSQVLAFIALKTETGFKGVYWGCQ